MKPPTTGERSVWGNRICDDPLQLHYKRFDQLGLDVHWERQYIAGFDAAIAAERERIAAFCEANPTKYGDQLAEMIRARGNA